MKRLILLFLCLSGYFAQAQHTISGTFSPAKDYTWIIAYRLKPGTQVYAADTAINDGEFVLKIPENAEPGTYRLVYAVPQEEFYFDVIFNGKEDIKLDFEIEKGPNFTASKENILFSTYFKEMQEIQRQLIAFYSSGSSDSDAFAKITQNYTAIQNSYSKKSENLMVQEFIKANRPYLPPRHEPLEEYVKNRKNHYFDALDFTNPVLQASGFLSDKSANYVFTALPLQQISQSETEKVIQENVQTVTTKLEGLEDTYKFHIYYTLWVQAAASSFNKTSDFIYSTYLKSMADSTGNQEIKAEIETHNRLRLGATAPDIEWQVAGKIKKLSTLEENENYVLIFWSSTCSHCLKELPALHKELRKNENIKVIAIGLEDDELSWRLESEKLSNFEHAIALGKWESNDAMLYDIHATPTYFILDSDKRIIAKPESDKDVIEFLKE